MIRVKRVNHNTFHIFYQNTDMKTTRIWDFVLANKPVVNESGSNNLVLRFSDKAVADQFNDIHVLGKSPSNVSRGESVASDYEDDEDDYDYSDDYNDDTTDDDYFEEETRSEEIVDKLVLIDVNLEKQMIVIDDAIDEIFSLGVKKGRLLAEQNELD